MSEAEKIEFASMLGTDLAGLEKLTSDVHAAAASSLVEDNDDGDEEVSPTPVSVSSSGGLVQPLLGHSSYEEKKKKNNNNNSMATAIQGPVTMMKEAPIKLAPYQMAEDWVYEEETVTKGGIPVERDHDDDDDDDDDVEIIMPERPVDMHSLVEEMRRAKRTTDMKTKHYSSSNANSSTSPSAAVSEIPLNEVEEKLKAKFDMIKQFREMKVQQHLKTSQLKHQYKNTKLSSSKRSSHCKSTHKVDDEPQVKATEAWQDLIELESETKNVFKQRVNKAVADGDATKPNSSSTQTDVKIVKKKKDKNKKGKEKDKETSSSECSSTHKVKAKVDQEWKALLMEEDAKVNIFKQKVSGNLSVNPSPP
jgi:hypothetical protein